MRAPAIALSLLVALLTSAHAEIRDGELYSICDLKIMATQDKFVIGFLGELNCNPPSANCNIYKVSPITMVFNSSADAENFKDGFNRYKAQSDCRDFDKDTVADWQKSRMRNRTLILGRNYTTELKGSAAISQYVVTGTKVLGKNLGEMPAPGGEKLKSKEKGSVTK